MDELAAGVVAYAAEAEREGGVAEGLGADAGDPNVDGLGLDVLRVFGDAGMAAAGAEELVGLGRAVAADDIDDAAGTVQAGHEVVEEVELGGVVGALFLGAAVAEEVVELVEGLGDVGVADAVDDIEALVGVGAAELELVAAAVEGDGRVRSGGGRCLFSSRFDFGGVGWREEAESKCQAGKGK